jgi:hypothetical protein
MIETSTTLADEADQEYIISKYEESMLAIILSPTAQE